MEKNAARKTLGRIKKYRDRGDQRWMELLAQLADSDGYIALGYTTLLALTTAELGISNRQASSVAVRAGRARLALKAAGVAVPNRGVSVNGLRHLTAARIPLVAETMANGHSLNAALAAARAGAPLAPLFAAPAGRPDRPDDIHANVLMLAQAIESVGFSTPVRDLLDAEPVVLACLEGLTAIAESLTQIEGANL